MEIRTYVILLHQFLITEWTFGVTHCKSRINPVTKFCKMGKTIIDYRYFMWKTRQNSICNFTENI